MKIQQINEHQLEIHESGMSGVVLAVVFVLIGVGVALSPLLSSAPWWVALVGLFFAAVGIMSALGATKTDAVLRNDATSEATRTKVLGKKSSSLSFEPAQVSFVGLDTVTEHDRSSGNTGPTRRRASTLFVALNDNTQIPLATARSGGNSINGISLDSFGKAPLSKEASQIAAFYGVQVNSTSGGDMGIEQLVQAASTVAQAVTKQPNQPFTVTEPKPASLPSQAAGNPGMVQPQVQAQPTPAPNPTSTAQPVPQTATPAESAPVAPSSQREPQQTIPNSPQPNEPPRA